jgi:hypothetical protein
VLDSADWLEPVVMQTGDPDFALVSGRSVILRALVKSPQAGLPAPSVQLKVFDGNKQQLAIVSMTAPATISSTIDRTSIVGNYTFKLDSAWVRPGVSVEIVVNPVGLQNDPTPANNSLNLNPRVGPEVVMYITAVPGSTQVEGTALLPKSGGGAAAIRQAIRSTVMAMYPVSDVKVRIHAPYTFNKATTMRANWGVMLGEINQLRIDEGNHGHYMGFIPHSPLGSTTTGNSFMPGTVSTMMGAKNLTNWGSGNSQHELGHNFGLGHVSCAPIGAETDLGYDAEQNAIVKFSDRKNMMSYCGPAWISRGNYLYTLAKFAKSGLDKPTADIIGEWQ